LASAYLQPLRFPVSPVGQVEEVGMGLRRHLARLVCAEDDRPALRAETAHLADDRFRDLGDLSPDDSYGDNTIVRARRVSPDAGFCFCDATDLRRTLEINGKQPSAPSRP
jgi:hypothetical protein